MEERIITSQECISEGLAALAKLEPKFNLIIKTTEEIPLRRTSEGFDRLLSNIVSQQLSVAAADAIWNKIELAGLNKIQKIRKVSDQELRDVGLSKQKIKYVRSLANANINYRSLRTMPTSQVVNELTQVSGIGSWTAEIYAMFSLGLSLIHI